MSSSPVRAELRSLPTPPQPVQVKALQGDAIQHLWDKLNSTVQDHAYGLYESEGRSDGRDVDHWAAAEAKYKSSNVEVRESGPWYHCNFVMPGMTAGNVQLAIQPEQFLIHLSAEAEGGFAQDGSAPVFYAAKWPQTVDPSTAAAYIRGEALTIEVKKAVPAEAPVAAVESQPEAKQQVAR